MATKLQVLVVAFVVSISSASNDELSAFDMSAPEDAALQEAALEEAALRDDPIGVEDFTHALPLVQMTSGRSLPEAPRKVLVQTHLRATPKASKTATEVVAKHEESATKVAPRPPRSNMSHTDLEDMVNHLVTGESASARAIAAFGATPFGGSVQKIVDVIEKDMMPKIINEHQANEDELKKLAADVTKCAKTKNVMVGIADKSKAKYLKFSPLHKTCRAGEAGLLTSKRECYEELADKKTVMELKCKEFVLIDQKFGNENNNRQIVKKGGSEKTGSYLQRITATICGNKCGMSCLWQKAKKRCTDATAAHDLWTAKCRKIHKSFDAKVAECNNLQDQMDWSACKRAIDMKDACETYAECYRTKKEAYLLVEKVVKVDEKDRQAEWKGLKRMQCLMMAFKDGKVTNSEIKACKDKTHSVKHLVIKYPVIAAPDTCEVPKLYPTTSEYKRAEFAPLPALAKGKAGANECTGVLEISTKPNVGSPKTCKCQRLTLNGPYTPGPMVMCKDCLGARRSTDKNSCPVGTKIFSPRNKEDWKTFLASAQMLRDPHFVIDVTKPSNGCGGCTANPMNSANAAQKDWVTSDGSPWWLRSTRYSEPNGDYHANCYLDLWRTPKDHNQIEWNDANCNYHSKSYYCQLESFTLKPKPGSPQGCVCEKVETTGKYSPGILLKCKGCLDVSKSTQKNSCPKGTKIFSPRSRADWKVFLDSATPLRSPHWIVDVTRPSNGCGGCTRHPMNSDTAAQKTWNTADRSDWWLRGAGTQYNEPNGDYTANCYLDLWQTPANENSVTFNDGRCNYHSNAYYCQTVKKR